MNKEESFKGNNDLTNEIGLRGDLRFIAEIANAKKKAWKIKVERKGGEKGDEGELIEGEDCWNK